MPAASALLERIGECEQRPRDFSARFERRKGSPARSRMRLQRRWTLGVTALAAVALPAFAEPGTWQSFQISDAVTSETAVRPMPFEQAGASFPGSAFYYLEADQPPLKIGEGIHSDAEEVDRGDAAGPAARSMRIDNSGVDRSRALQCMTAAIYYEAASEADAGQRAVAQVVLNRVAHPAYPNTVCGVVYQGSERSTGCQFSFTCDGSLARRPSKLFWDRAQAVAREALAGQVYAPVGLATHYHTTQVSPYWAPSLHYLGTIGAHRFYSFRGAAGRLSAFQFAYLGGEPMASPHARVETPLTAMQAAALDPVKVQGAFEALEHVRAAATPGVAPATGASPDAAPAPAYAAGIKARGGEELYRIQTLPQAHGIKPEYANSGRWIAQPGS